MKKKAIFVAATGQNVGKTTVCLGLLSALKKKFSKLGFLKPVGQQHEKLGDSVLVDKDVVLFKDFFDLSTDYKTMSPVIFPPGFTRDFIDEVVSEQALRTSIQESFESIVAENDYTVVEGTGHVGVGSIVNLNNAEVASSLGLDAVIIVEGGLGSAFDQLVLNKALFEQKGVRVRGVILNRVLDEKREMVVDYMSRALKPLDIPLIGAVPYNRLLSTPSMEDFDSLFSTQLLSGQEFLYRHFESMRLVATSVEKFKELTRPNQLIVTPASREDIIETVIDWHQTPEKEASHGLILTGRHPPSKALVAKLQKTTIPSLYAAHPTFEVMRLITSFVAKIRKEDVTKVQQAIDLVEWHLDLDQLL